jgi:hypothetical protein
MKGNTADPGAGQGDKGGDPGWVTARDAARQLGVSPRQLYDLIDRGALAAYHVDDDLVLRPGDLAAYRDHHSR